MKFTQLVDFINERKKQTSEISKTQLTLKIMFESSKKC